MHIPDGYLSPQTCAAMGTAMLPIWYIASSKVRSLLKQGNVALMAIGAAFAFVIMMFNVPVPDGTTAHATGGTLLAVTIGPWAAVISMSIALAIQALFFADGGILAFPANAFNMAVAGPLVGYVVYQSVAGTSSATSRRRWIGAAIGAYIGINVSAALTALEFGIQPLLFTAADGTPLYSPYRLELALPAMLFAHLLVAGPVEAVVTGAAVAYLQRAFPHLIQTTRPMPTAPSRRSYRALWAALAAIALLTPLGLLANGTAWGEWGPEELPSIVGFLPQGIRELSGLWAGILPGYSVPGWDSGPLAAVGYVVSALLGILLVAGAALLISRILARRSEGAA